MEFSKLLKKGESFKGTDGFTMIDGKPSNEAICDEMLGDDVQSPETCAHMVQEAINLGFSEEDANTFWGFKG